MRRIFIVASVSLFFGIINVCQAAVAADHLVISQVQITGGSGKTTNDFVEIHNPTDADIDLQGYRLVKRTQTGTSDTSLKSWTSSAIVPAHGYYLWANSSFTEISATPDVTTTGSIANDNGVALRNGPNDTGTIIDSVAWGAAANVFVEGAVFATNPEANQSLERSAESNDNVSDFFLQTTAHPRNTSSPAASVSPSPAPPSSPEAGSSSPTTVSPAFSVEISEIMPNPKGKDTGSEWVELKNSGPSSFDISLWYLDDDSLETMPGSSAWQLPESQTIAAGGFLALQIPKGKFALNNSGADAVRLFDNTKALRLRQAYEGATKEGFAYAKDASGNWIWTDNPTPGSGYVYMASVSYSHDIMLSEILSNPEGADQDGEFIELYNSGETRVDLADWVISNGRKRYVIFEEDLPSTEIGPREYLVFYREVSGISLKNSGGEDLKLYSPAGDLVDAVSLDASGKEAESFARSENESYLWTAMPTPGEANQFEGTAKIKTPAKKKAETVKPSEPVASEIGLSDIRSAEMGEELTTTGVVSTPPGILDDNVFYLAGSGIRVWLGDILAQTIKLGDRIKLTGLLSEFHKELQLKVAASSSLQIVAAGDAPAPHQIETGMVGEETEGFLAQIVGTITKSSGDTFFVDDGTGEARVYIKESTGIEKPRTEKGMAVSVIGIVSQYDGNYRLLPRYQSDLLFGAVAGTSAAGELPRTGIDFNSMIAILLGFAIILLIKTPPSSFLPLSKGEKQVGVERIF